MNIIIPSDAEPPPTHPNLHATAASEATHGCRAAAAGGVAVTAAGRARPQETWTWLTSFLLERQFATQPLLNAANQCTKKMGSLWLNEHLSQTTQHQNGSWDAWRPGPGQTR